MESRRIAVAAAGGNLHKRETLTRSDMRAKTDKCNWKNGASATNSQQ